MKTWSKHKIYTYIILLVLLVARFSESLLVLIYDDLLDSVSRQVHKEFFTFWVVGLYRFLLAGSLFLIALAVKFNRDELQRMNVDRFFPILLIISGFLARLAVPNYCLSFITFLYMIYLLFGEKGIYSVVEYPSSRKALLAVGIASWVIALLLMFVDVEFLGNKQLLAEYVFQTFPMAVYEEAVYRGVLYMLLMDLGITETKAVYIQALLFWGSHVNRLLAAPLFFWVILPLISIAMGYVVFRSKSLTVGSLLHIAGIASFLNFSWQA